ncbi:Ankyrin repeat-containing domain [Forsythia ovata]|uniref:Ankyrin repeat-containing domain n=1 Tax=Forsythia ovata TaxID=205694 RepID=A0ABD1RHF9_9LAMI
MICARNKQEECLKLLASAGADFGLTNMSAQCARSIAGSMRWKLGFQQAVLDVIQTGKIAESSNSEIFSSLLFSTRENDIEALKKLIKQPAIDFNQRDESRFSAVMVTAAGGHVEAFRLLVNAGADVEIQNKYGETAISLADANQNSDAFKKVLTEYAYAKGNHNSSGSSALHRAARIGELDLAWASINEERDIDVLDSMDILHSCWQQGEVMEACVSF